MPRHPAQAAAGKQRQPERKLLPAPRRLEKAVETILCHPLLDEKEGRMRETNVAVQLLPEIDPPRLRVDEERVTARMALRPVADVVEIDYAERPGDADQHTEVDEKPLEPQRTLIAPVNQAAVEAQRVAEAERRDRERKTHQHCARAAGERRNHKSRPAGQQIPERLGWFPPHLTVARIRCCVGALHAVWPVHGGMSFQAAHAPQR